MRVMVDSNVLISALVFKSKSLEQMLYDIVLKYSFVLTSGVINESLSTVKKKFPSGLLYIESFFNSKFHEYVDTDKIDVRDVIIRDFKNKRILSDAMIADIDILITGDNDFYDYEYEGLKILRPAEFIKQYC